MELIEGIIINQTKYQENSKIIHVLTNDCMKSLLVRASCSFNSKNFAYSQELTKINFQYSESKKKTFDIMSSGIVLDSYKNIKDDYNKLNITVEILKLTLQANEHVNSYSNLYKLLSYTLDGINNNTLEIGRYYELVFKLKLLFILGIGPNFNGCTKCGKEANDYFSINIGGVICEKCLDFEKDIFFGDYIKIMKILYLGKFENLDNNLFQSIINIKNYYEEMKNIISQYYNKYI